MDHPFPFILCCLPQYSIDYIMISIICQYFLMLTLRCIKVSIFKILIDVIRNLTKIFGVLGKSLIHAVVVHLSKLIIRDLLTALFVPLIDRKSTV